MPWDLSNKKRFIGAFAFLAITVSLAVIWAAYEWVSRVNKVYRAKDWEATPCRIEEVYVDTDHLTEPAIFFWTIRYKYQCNGQEYSSKRYNMIRHRDLTKEEKERVRKERFKYGPFHEARGPYRAGEKATCFVNPQNPSEAVLNRDYSYKEFMRPILLTPVLLVYSISTIIAFIQTYRC